MARQHRARRAVAAVEFAFIAPVLFGLLLGVWEIGRVVQVQQMLSGAAREGARIAAQGQTISLSNAPQQVTVSSAVATDVTVTRAVDNFLTQAGIDTTGLTVAFVFTSGDTSLTNPWQAAKGQQFRIDVSLPYDSFRWSPINVFGGTTLSASVTWASVVDDPFVINTTIPQ